MEKIGSERFTMIRVQERILSQFTPEQQIEIKKRMNILSSIVYFIGQDFKIDIELNSPGEGWHWDFKDNIVRVDPKDLLERPIEYSCYVMGHEAGHRRVSRTDFIPQEVWQMPGFSFLMNAIEDPRENNFVADNYPAFARRLQVAFDEDWDIEQKSKEIAQERIGRCPRFMEAGYEYIRLWFHERLNHKEFEGLTHEQATKKLKEYVREDILPEVRQVVLDTLDVARQSWWLYPTKKEADSRNGEEIISQYAEGSYIINHADIWPIFKTLVDQDVQDEKTKKLIEELQKQKQEQQKKEKENQTGESEEPQEDTDGTNEKSNEEKSKGKQEESTQSGEPKDDGESRGSSSSQELIQDEIQKMLEGMSDEERQKLEEKTQAHAQKIIDELAEELSKQLQGKLIQNPKEKQEQEESDKKENKDNPESKEEIKSLDHKESKEQKESREKREKEINEVRKKLQEIADKDIGRYDRDRREVAPIINRLTNDLRAIFSERRKTNTKTGFKSGRSIDIGRRITEIAKGILPIDSHAWIKKERPTEKDYAFSVLVDLSGSMQNGQKIEETFKAVIALSEVFNNLGMKFNIIGFNNRLHDFLKFGQKLDQEKRKAMEQMVREVNSHTSIGNPMFNDDGWAVQQASQILSSQKESQKILIVLSDGQPEPSSAHNGSQFNLKKIVEDIEKKDQHEIIGLGLGLGTDHVSNYYKRSISDIPVQDLPIRLAQLLKKVVER